MQLSELDLRILSALQRDASLSNQALAEKVFTSAATSLRRVRALEVAGVIEQRVAVLSPAKLGPLLLAITEITLDVQNADRFDAFDALIRDEAAVTQAYRTAPSVDFTLMLTLSDMAAYQGLVQRVFTAANNVRNVRTRFVTQRSKFSAALPLPSSLTSPLK